MGFDPPAQSDTSYEADALPPSHHGWIGFAVISDLMSFDIMLLLMVFDSPFFKNYFFVIMKRLNKRSNLKKKYKLKLKKPVLHL